MQKELDRFQSIPAAFASIAQRCADRTVYRRRPSLENKERGDGWSGRTYREVASRVAAVADYLLSVGLAPGARVAIISNTRPEWMEADLAILACGGVTVSVYQSLTPSDVGYILADSGSKIVFIENEAQLKKLDELVAHGCVMPATEDRPAGEATFSFTRVISFEAIEGRGDVAVFEEIIGARAGVATLPEQRIAQISRHDLASLVYTSGTTGPAKGVVQTHGNHLSNVRQAREGEVFDESSILFLFLPLAHSFARLIGYIGFLTEAELRFPTVADRKSSTVDPALVSRDLRESDCTIIAVVPRLLEKIQGTILERAHGTGLSATILKGALNAARAMARGGEFRERVSLLQQIVFFATDGIRRKVKEAIFGRNFRYAISGGAKLSPEVALFFKGLGIEVLEGYGLTETCVATNVNRPGRAKIGTVGPVLAPDIELRIAEDGEILFRGPNVTSGYYNRPTATKQSWDSEGWFHTGDTGSIDTAGRLSIEGRKKELIVTSGGKKIPPDPIEQKLKTIRGVSQAVLVGEGKKYCAAILTLNESEIVSECRARGLTPTEPLHDCAVVHQCLWEGVERLNKNLASFESVKKIALLPGDFTVENGLLTPTLKVKRTLVVKRFEREVARLFE